MQVSINLATRPFIELRPLFARLRLAMVGLAVLAVALGAWLHVLNGRARAAQTQMDALRARTTGFEQERQRDEARMRQPQNMAVLERSQFLNGVFAAKSFSWTAVMMDLERVLPAGVQVTSIDPVIAKDGAVSIRLRVSGDRERAVELVRNLETSQRFLKPRLVDEAAQTREGNRGGAAAVPVSTGIVEFDILSGYNPLPSAPEKKKAAAESSDVNRAMEPRGRPSARKSHSAASGGVR